MEKYIYLEKDAKKCVDESKKGNKKILTTVDGWITDKEALILRDFLWYARDNNVEVIFVPIKS